MVCWTSEGLDVVFLGATTVGGLDNGVLGVRTDELVFVLEERQKLEDGQA